jgi:hypothetical protein
MRFPFDSIDKSGGQSACQIARVRDLRSLLSSGKHLPTIYANPPWDYKNRSARGAVDTAYSVRNAEEQFQNI